jgi:hypothetical protein
MIRLEVILRGVYQIMKRNVKAGGKCQAKGNGLSVSSVLSFFFR